jgi:hypothetical protein
MMTNEIKLTWNGIKSGCTENIVNASRTDIIWQS